MDLRALELGKPAVTNGTQEDRLDSVSVTPLRSAKILHRRYEWIHRPHATSDLNDYVVPEIVARASDGHRCLPRHLLRHIVANGR